MSLFARLLQNHVLANLIFILVLATGSYVYTQMPRQQDPTINFNWIQVVTFLPGASAIDIEKYVTEPLEDAMKRVADIKFVSSSSQDGISTSLIRFEEISERTFDKRVNDLRREIQNKESELPDAATSPLVIEITSSNGFPTASVIVYSHNGGDHLYNQARQIEKDLEDIKGVDQVDPIGLRVPELQVRFKPDKLTTLGINPNDIVDTIQANFRDISAGEYHVGGESWLVRVLGTSSDPKVLADMLILSNQGEIPLSRIADVVLTPEKADHTVRYRREPAVLMTITKQADINTLDLLQEIKTYIEQRNMAHPHTGIALQLVDDQTQTTRDALTIMQNNAVLGLLMVLLVTYLFLGLRMALLTSIGIPFILAGTFILLNIAGQTLNVSVLLGIVISLGMLVDDAVVVVEAIYYRIERGVNTFSATTEALKEVVAPVTTSVLTTLAAFLPLMLIPGILGKFMMVIPMVISMALCVSLLEAYWMLPAHIMTFKSRNQTHSGTRGKRAITLHKIRLIYTRLLIKALRSPRRVLLILLTLFIVAISALATGAIKIDFFASDPLRLFYINVTMPIGTPLSVTENTIDTIEQKMLPHLKPKELRASVAISGQMMTETSVFSGDRYGQLMVSLHPKQKDMRDVDAIIASMRDDIESITTAENIYFFSLQGGPPKTKPIDIKVIGTDFDEINAATTDLVRLMRSMPQLKNIEIDNAPGQNTLDLKLNLDHIHRAGLNPAAVSQMIHLLVNGAVVSTTRHRGDELDVRVLADTQSSNTVYDILEFHLTAPDGKKIPLHALVHTATNKDISHIRHYKFRRAITVKADIDKSQTNEKKANDDIKAAWAPYRAQHSNTALDFSGLLDDLNETISSLFFYMLVGIGLIYIILGTQFRSYFQPLLVLSTIPVAFSGVILGLLVTQNPLSLFTAYGIVALGGIAVNSAIVLISAANDRIKRGMSINHAIIYASRRRVIPILITSLTTIAGLFSLATGLGGKSLLWGPVATAIVWGLVISTLLTLFTIPLLYRYFMLDLPVSKIKPNHSGT